jgi:uncharacterized membrane protein
MALVQKPKVSTKAVVDSRIMTVGTTLSQEYINSLRAKNDSVWNTKKSWFLCFYFGQGDDRLWVPKRTPQGQHPDKRVINFAHPDGKQAAQILMLCYLIGTVGVVLLGSFVIGYRG